MSLVATPSRGQLRYTWRRNQVPIGSLQRYCPNGSERRRQIRAERARSASAGSRNILSIYGSRAVDGNAVGVDHASFAFGDDVAGQLGVVGEDLAEGFGDFPDGAVHAAVDVGDVAGAVGGSVKQFVQEGVG